MTAARPALDEEACVAQIENLRAEIGHALAAISSNALAGLEDSLWRQEALCNGLKNLLRTLHNGEAAPSVAKRLQGSMTALHQLNRTYAEVVRQAQASNQLFSALCRGFQPEDSGRGALSTGSRCSLEA